MRPVLRHSAARRLGLLVLVPALIALGPTRARGQSGGPGNTGDAPDLYVPQDRQRLLSAKERMLEDLETYFEGEKQGAIWLMALGGGGLVVGATLMAQAGAHRGAGYPVLGFGALELALGVGLWLRTDPQLAALRATLETRPSRLREQELRRMRRVNLGFRIYVWTEIALFAGGIGMAAAGAVKDSETLKGAGVGLAVESAILFGYDFFASRRARRYTAELEAFRVVPLLSFGEGRHGGLGVVGRF